jgi:serine/threonine-protein kinase
MPAEDDRAPLSREVKHLESEVGTHAHHPLLHLPFLEQLKQRNVVRVAVLYGVVCWLVLDPVHVLFHMLEVPAWANRLVVMLMAVGFPLVVIFAWVYEITPEGLKPTVEVPHSQSIRKLTGRRLDRAIIAVLALALAYFVIDKFWISKHLPASQPTASEAQTAAAASGAASVAAFNPPAHSVAVLPFINLSGDQAQEYFSDGLTEELLNSLAEIKGLQVAARTSAFSFKGKDNDIGSIARKLNVAALLEGSVRRSEHTVRVTAQLINAVTGFHLWSKTYDRDLGDVLKLQTEIANTVAGSLKVTLLGDEAAKIELGGTRNPAAFDGYLRAMKAFSSRHDAKDQQAAIDAFGEAIRFDSSYALAFAGRSRALSGYAQEYATGAAIRENFNKAEADARKAIALAPELADGHLALAETLQSGTLEYARALEEYDRAAALGPGNAEVLREYGRFVGYMGRSDAGIAATRRAIVLDPLNPRSHYRLGAALYSARRYDESVAAYQVFINLDPDSPHAHAFQGLAYYGPGNLQSARAACEIKSGTWNQLCLAVTYDKLGRHADAEAELAKMRAALGDAASYQYAEIYAQWGRTGKALDSLETALQVRDTGLTLLKTDPLMDPLRKEPRFQAIERALKFPS